MKTNFDFLEDLKGENNKAFGELYSDYFGVVNRFVNKNNGTFNDAQDIFQDTMLVLVEKLRKDNFILTASIKTYIMAIAKHLWLNKLRTSYRETELTDIHNNQFFEEISHSIEQEMSYFEKLQSYMTKITDHCNRLLHDMFFRNKPIEQIQAEYGYSSIHNAQNQKHKCVEQIKKVRSQEEKK